MIFNYFCKTSQIYTFSDKLSVFRVYKKILLFNRRPLVNNMKRKNELLKILPGLRSEINKVDDELITLIIKRRELSLKAIKLKNKAQAPLREKSREEEVLKRILSIAKKKKLDAHFVSRIFQEIIHDSVRLQQKYITNFVNKPERKGKIKIALQGIEESYSYLAAKKYFNVSGDRFILSGKNKFEEVVESVENREADYAILPVENTISGGINEVYDLLLNTTLSITGEEIYKVNHCLASIDKTPLKKIKKIYAHYQAAAQCGKFLETLSGCAVEFFPDTAMSFRKIEEEKNPYTAAIAGEEAAKIYGLVVLKSNIANQPKNFTRFLVAAREPVKVDKKTVCKTSLVISTPHKAGALANVLLEFSKRNINLTKLDSRPVTGKPWEEMFYIDFIGNISDPEIEALLNSLIHHTKYMKVLGSYPACYIV
jgi:chorismate mutase / prephenate dehydratase